MLFSHSDHKDIIIVKSPVIIGSTACVQCSDCLVMVILTVQACVCVAIVQAIKFILPGGSDNSIGSVGLAVPSRRSFSSQCG